MNLNKLRRRCFLALIPFVLGSCSKSTTTATCSSASFTGTSYASVGSTSAGDNLMTVTVNGNPTTANGADMLQGCTRMARADYCSAGMPNTIDGTPIHIDDVFSARPAVDGFAFEAAWRGAWPSWPGRRTCGRP